MGVPVTSGNQVQVLRNGVEIFPAMLEAIRGAEHTIDLLTYVWWGGDISREFSEALAERAEAGLRVRVLVDAIGGRLLPEENVERMVEAGVLFERFRGLDDLRLWRKSHRTHRRVLLVDGQIGFTGGVGIAGEWEGDASDPDEWRDTHLRVVGPAVDGLRAAFLDNWAETDHPLLDDAERYPAHDAGGSAHLMVVRSSAGHGISAMAILKRLLIEIAQERVRITSPYLAPEPGAVDALRRARDRGVDVQILIPGEHIDKRVSALAAAQHFDELLELGIDIRIYQRTMLHAKTMTVDGIVADVGSANFNSRSFAQDEEVDVVAFDPDLAAELDAHFDEDLQDADQVTRDRWEERGQLQRLAEGAVGLVDEVM
jgi:cardiolipin synthase